MSEAALPSEDQRKAFISRLAEFRNALPPEEQGMLDALVRAAVQGRSADDVAPYWYMNPIAYSGYSPLHGEETRAPGQTSDPWTNPWTHYQYP
jgi:hypothetical protein